LRHATHQTKRPDGARLTEPETNRKPSERCVAEVYQIDIGAPCAHAYCGPLLKGMSAGDAKDLLKPNTGNKVKFKVRRGETQLDIPVVAGTQPD